MAGRILIIRGGAIGDFLLTLPALHLLRDHLPDCHLEILGYQHIVAIAEGRFYANASRSIEYGPLAGFFGRNSPLDEELSAFFQSFDQIVSYLFDPDELFANNLKRIGIKDFLRGPGKIHDGNHATMQLAEPLQNLAMFLENPALRIYPGPQDLASARALIGSHLLHPLLVLHPGSGGRKKVWPVPSWIKLLERLLRENDSLHLVICGGEADREIIQSMRKTLAGDERILWLQDHPLPLLGAVLHLTGNFIGHDSGISHLAAAAGCRGLLLFGPTDPAIWAPPNPEIKILRAPGGKMENLSQEVVAQAVCREFSLSI
jgi:heptosyltransferase-3